MYAFLFDNFFSEHWLRRFSINFCFTETCRESNGKRIIISLALGKEMFNGTLTAKDKTSGKTP